MMGRELVYKLKRERLYREGHVSRPPDLEDLEAEQREIERKDEYVVALRRERMGVEAEMARLKGLRPEARTWMPWEMEQGEPPTVAERIAAAEARIAAIGAELARVS